VLLSSSIYTYVWAYVIYIRDKFYRLSDAFANAGNWMLCCLSRNWCLTLHELRCISQRVRACCHNDVSALRRRSVTVVSNILREDFPT
jgi:hypothetical protein